MDKFELRKQYGFLRKNIKNRQEKELAAKNKLTEFLLDKPSIFCYVSMGSELSTLDFITEQINNKSIFVPYTQNNVMKVMKLLSSHNLVADKMGNIPLSEMQNTDEIPSAVVVPMLAFNKDNFRLGYGGGYYDRYLCNYLGLKVGLAFDEQYAILPVEQYDIALDVIITPTKIIYKK